MKDISIDTKDTFIQNQLCSYINNKIIMADSINKPDSLNVSNTQIWNNPVKAKAEVRSDSNGQILENVTNFKQVSADTQPETFKSSNYTSLILENKFCLMEEQIFIAGISSDGLELAKEDFKDLRIPSKDSDSLTSFIKTVFPLFADRIKIAHRKCCPSYNRV